MSHHSVRRIALAAAVIPLLLAGCNNREPVPKLPDADGSTPTASDSASETAPTGPVEPTLPPEAQGKGVEAAEAFVRYYIAVVDFSRLTMDPHYIRKLSAPTCAGCNGLADLLARVRTHAGRIVGGDQTPRSVRVEKLGVPGAAEVYRVAAVVQTTEQEITQSGVDGLDGVREAEKLDYRLVVLRNGSDWQVSEWDIL